MIKIRMHNDFSLQLEILQGGVKIDLATVLNLGFRIKDRGYLFPIDYQSFKEGNLYLELYAERVGTYIIVAEFDLPDDRFDDGLRHITVDADAFKVVPRDKNSDDIFDISLSINI